MTTLICASFVFVAVWFVAALVARLHDCLVVRFRRPALDVDAVIAASDELGELMARFEGRLDAPVTTTPVVMEAITIDADRRQYEAMSNKELRVICTNAGVMWRNAHGVNKHLKKSEMIAALI
jgi:hypothetical protein